MEDIEIVQQHPDQTLIKIKQDYYLKIKDYKTIERQVEANKLVEDKLPVPKILKYGESSNETGYIFFEAVEHEKDSKPITKESYYEIINTLKDITNKNLKVRDYMKETVENIVHKLGEGPAEIINNIFENIDWEKYHMCLNHGDLHPGNIITNKHGEAKAILDWEYATYAPEFTETITAQIYEPQLIEDISYPEQIIFLSTLDHINKKRTYLQPQCIKIINKELTENSPNTLARISKEISKIITSF